VGIFPPFRRLRYCTPKVRDLSRPGKNGCPAAYL